MAKSLLGCLTSKGVTPTSSGSSSGSHVTDAPSIPRHHIGPAEKHLRHEVLKMYWRGVRRELPHILLTLKRWQTNPDFAKTVLPDEEDLFIHGYDTFLDQVSHSSRQYSQWYSRRRARQDEKGSAKPPTYTEALADRGWDIFSEGKSQAIKEEIRAILEQGAADITPQDSARRILRRRARMLLQSAQFLDIDKVIEYREPEKLISFWKKPATPQVTVSFYDDTHMPVFAPQRCTECRSIIRGSMFKTIDETETIICETCYRKNHYGDPTFTKVYKHSCLDAAIPPKIGRSICQCTTIRRRDERGRLRALFPIDPGADSGSHLNQETPRAPGKARCGLYQLTDMVAETKHAASQAKLDRAASSSPTTLEEARRERTALLKRLAKEAQERAETRRDSRPTKVKNVNAISPEATTAEFGTSYGLTTDEPEDIPFYLRATTDKYPYGNVHMALRFGPLVIENGVSHTHGGALITSRDPPSLQVLRDGEPQDIEYSLLLLTGSSSSPYGHGRQLCSQYRPRPRKRYKAMTKQVVGGAFCGFLDQGSEEEIVDSLLRESRRLVEDGISVFQKQELMDKAVERLMAQLVPYLESRVEVYVGSICSRLLDPAVELRWNPKTNNCQMFCDNLMDQGLFGGFFAPPHTLLPSQPLKEDGSTAANVSWPLTTDATTSITPLSTGTTTTLPGTDYTATAKIQCGGGVNLTGPLYLLSFLVRAESYSFTEKTSSKHDVPNGLTEEYLLKFRFGRHDDSDIIDTLAEYWTDWAGLFSSSSISGRGEGEGFPYDYQDLFPWDCTEAYGGYPVSCGRDAQEEGHNLAKHVWAFPFDSFSLVGLHLARGREMYPLPVPSSSDPSSFGSPRGEGRGVRRSGVMTDPHWFANRLTVLLAQDVLLTAAAAMSSCQKFRQSTLWLGKTPDQTRDRLKLGGIHRAQPFSHHFERGSYHLYFVAGWAHLTRKEKIRAYEKLRDWRATRVDMGDGRTENGESDGDGGGCGGGCGAGFSCGAAAGCAAGCQADGGGDTGCGSGCVSTCNGGDGGDGGDGDGGGCGGCGGCGGGCG